MANWGFGRWASMVNIGFICEGDTEKKIIKSDKFQQLLEKLNLICVQPIIDAKGNGNLLPHNIQNHLEILKASKAQFIFILTDLDTSSCITETKNRITQRANEFIIVARRQIESWFCSDIESIRKTIQDDKFNIDFPELLDEPIKYLKIYLAQKEKTGIGDKDIFAKRMIRNGFSIENAAKHPNCQSAQYFLNKLTEISKTKS
jgi:hypothetical protein